ncbi:MAG TPA: Wzz/FepE/Etk N-terminal domain-containing protein [Methyloceanibacter sp.]|nr:Wzz/FepE/Etk N-terminal domain-containing protein [Methyloceanibacter sp.]
MEAESAYASNPTFADIFRVLQRRLPLIGVTIAVVMALAVGYLLVATPYYTASTEILIDPRKKNTVQNEVVPSGLGTTAGDNFALVDSQVKVILSNAVLRPVVKSQHLAADPEFNGEAPSLLSTIGGSLSVFGDTGSGVPSSPEDRALLALQEAVKITRDAQTYVIKIAVSTTSPVKSATIAQAIAASYLSDQSETKIEITQQVSSQMDGQLAALRERLRQAETQVQAFRAAHNLQQGENGLLVDTRQLEELNQKQTDAQAEMARSAAKKEQVERLLREGIDPETVGDAINSATVSRLRDQYALASRREAILSANLLPSHPTLKQAHSEVERLQGLIKAEVRRISKGIDLEYETAKQRLDASEAAVAASRQEANTHDSAYIKLRELEREAETTRAVYESFLSRVKEMNESERIDTPDARIISPATIPQKANWPKKSLILALALVFGSVMGCSLALATAHFDRRIYSGTELLTSTGLKPLVSIPTLNAKRSLVEKVLGQRPQRASFYDLVLETLEGDPHTGFRAAVLRLLSYLVDFNTADEPRVVLLTSSASGEGKSALALSLAVAASSAGIRTLLIDASTADPALTKVFGQSEMHDSDTVLDDWVITDQRLGLSFLSLTDNALVPSGLSNRHALSDDLTSLASGYELTIIDGGRLHYGRDASALIAASQAILFLSKVSATSRETAAFAASDLLQMADGRRCAAVLTMAEA